ncbi:MAG: hypothetical protein JW891_04325 [Candidatus Lokiarchaeota archaeon]|nr:hypothetical protein [Candidatus Lokiarchaeota archaeon]
MFNFFDTYSEPVPRIKYTCQVCNKKVRYITVIKCEACSRSICKSCNHGGLCKPHYEALSVENKKVFDDIWKAQKTEKGIVQLALGILIALSGLGYVLSFLYVLSQATYVENFVRKMNPNFNWIGLIVFNIVWTIVVIGLVIVKEKLLDGIDVHYLKEKRQIYNNI